MHTHYWIIETPNGPEAEGVCRDCGATRAFPNSLPENQEGTKRMAIRTDKEKNMASNERATAKCKHCGLGVDVTGLKGRAITSAFVSHSFRCPKAPPRGVRKANRPQPELGVSVAGESPKVKATPSPATLTPIGKPTSEDLGKALEWLISQGVKFKIELTFGV